MNAPADDAIERVARVLIAAERKRQVEIEGWTVEHDTKQGGARLACAALAYIRNDYGLWPWGREYWKPRDSFDNLVRGGALALAALDVKPTAYGAREAHAEAITALSALITKALTAAGLLTGGESFPATVQADEDVVERVADTYGSMIEHHTLAEVVEYARQNDEWCCTVGCGSGACEACPCCAAGWCVTGLHGLPESAEDWASWLDVAREHNPLAARAAALDPKPHPAREIFPGTYGGLDKLTIRPKADS